jgi:hypothetical protein
MVRSSKKAAGPCAAPLDWVLRLAARASCPTSGSLRDALLRVSAGVAPPHQLRPMKHFNISLWQTVQPPIVMRAEQAQAHAGGSRKAGAGAKDLSAAGASLSPYQWETGNARSPRKSMARRQHISAPNVRKSVSCVLAGRAGSGQGRHRMDGATTRRPLHRSVRHWFRLTSLITTELTCCSQGEKC